MLAETYRQCCESRGIKPRPEIASIETGTLCLPGNTFERFTSRIVDEDVEVIVSALSSSGGTLLEVLLPYNHITSMGGLHIAASIAASGCLDSIAVLDLSYNSIGADAGVALAKALQSNTTLMELRLAGNPLGSDGDGVAFGYALGDALKLNATLHSLDLYSTDLGNKSLVPIVASLAENKGLVTLNLSKPLLPSPDDVRYVVQHLALALPRNSHLQALDLGYFGLYDEHLQHLFTSLCTSGIIALGVRANKLSQDSGRLLARLLDRREDFVSLDVSCNAIGDAGAKFLAESIRQHPRLQTLALESAGIRAEGIAALAEAIARCRPLRSLTLWGNQLQGEAASDLYAIQDRIRRLDHADISFQVVDGAAVVYKRASDKLVSMLPNQNQLYAYYLSRCGHHGVGKPNKAVLALLAEDEPSRMVRLRAESEARDVRLEDLLEMERELAGPQGFSSFEPTTPLARRTVFAMGSTVAGSAAPAVYVGARGMLPILDLVSVLPLVEELDLSCVSSWFAGDAAAAIAGPHGVAGNEVVARLCEVMRELPALRTVDIRSQPIGCWAAQQILEAVRANPRLTKVLITRDGVDRELYYRLERALEENALAAPALLPPPPPPAELPAHLRCLPVIDRKTVREQQLLRAMLAEDANFASVLTPDALSELVLHARVMALGEVVLRCGRQGLRGDGAHLFILKSGTLRAFVDLSGIPLQRGAYFGDTYAEVIFPTCRLDVEVRGEAYALPLERCTALLSLWSSRLSALYTPHVTKAPLLQPVDTWTRVRLCTCAAEREYTAGETVLAAGAPCSALWLVLSHDGFVALAGTAEDKVVTGRYEPYALGRLDMFGTEALLTPKSQSSVTITAGRSAHGTYRCAVITGSAVSLIRSQLRPVLAATVRPYSLHEDLRRVAAREPEWVNCI